MNWDKIFTKIDTLTKRKDGKRDYCSCVPDVWFGIDISEACRIHDEHYINKNVSKQEADIQLLFNIQAIAIEHKCLILYLIGFVYYFGVRYLGSIYEW